MYIDYIAKKNQHVNLKVLNHVLLLVGSVGGSTNPTEPRASKGNVCLHRMNILSTVYIFLRNLSNIKGLLDVFIRLFGACVGTSSHHSYCSSSAPDLIVLFIIQSPTFILWNLKSLRKRLGISISDRRAAPLRDVFDRLIAHAVCRSHSWQIVAQPQSSNA